MADPTRPGQPSVPAGPDLAEMINRFAELCEASADERALWLDTLDQRDPAAALMLRRMLEAEASGQAQTLDTSLLDLDAELIGSNATVGATLDAMPSDAPGLGGRYEVLRPVGFGANGDVYLARQRHPVEREVAIKVLRPSQVRPSTVERMAREATALAALSHPNIATVFEAGQTDDGRPFIATEYVAGEPIDQWCKSTEAPARACIRTLALVCRGVEHMHQRGIIHRDLKPTNILVAGTPEDPCPKILDLGIAKIIGDDAQAPPTLTQQGALLGSLGYIAPEQFEGGAADVRSDLFALGRVLEGLPGGVDGLTAAQRRDAAAIARRATRTDPRERYQSAGDMADDLEALLEGRPVDARRQSLGEALFRFMRRNKAGSAITMVAATALLASAVHMADQSARTARAHAAQKAVLTDTLDGMVRVLSRYIGTAPDSVAIAERLDGQLAELLAISPGDAELHVLRARLHTERARIAWAREDPQGIRALAAEGAQTMRRFIDPATADVQDIRHLCHSIVVEGDFLHGRGRLAEALALFEEVLAIHLEAHRRHPSHVGLLDDLNWSLDRVVAAQLPHPYRAALLEPRANPARGDLIALAEQRYALAIELLAMDDQRLLSHYNLAMAHQRLAQTLVGADDERAMAHLLEARAGLEALLRRDPHRWAFVDNLTTNWLISSSFSALHGRPADSLTDHEHAVMLIIDEATREHARSGRVDRRLRSRMGQSVGGLIDRLEAAGRHDRADAIRATMHRLEVDGDDARKP